MTLKCVKEFFDKEKNVRRNVGDVFEVTEKRAAQIRDYEKAKDKKYVEEYQEPPADETPEPPEQQQADETPKAAPKAKKEAGDK